MDPAAALSSTGSAVWFSSIQKTQPLPAARSEPIERLEIVQADPASVRCQKHIVLLMGAPIRQVTAVTLIDTGPLVALCDRRDKHHAWTAAALGSITGPLTTCEAVLTEACFPLKQQFGGAEKIFELLAPFS